MMRHMQVVIEEQQRPERRRSLYDDGACSAVFAARCSQNDRTSASETAG